MQGDKQNPASPGAITAREIAQQYTAEAVYLLVEVMRDTTQPGTSRARCAEALLAYGHGKPRQMLEHTHANDETRAADRIAEARRALMEALAKVESVPHTGAHVRERWRALSENQDGAPATAPASPRTL
jgi:hypothetical protein